MGTSAGRLIVAAVASLSSGHERWLERRMTEPAHAAIAYGGLARRRRGLDLKQLERAIAGASQSDRGLDMPRVWRATLALMPHAGKARWLADLLGKAFSRAMPESAIETLLHQLREPAPGNNDLFIRRDAMDLPSEVVLVRLYQRRSRGVREIGAGPQAVPDSFRLLVARNVQPVTDLPVTSTDFDNEDVLASLDQLLQGGLIGAT
jgi:hypothetical protein